MAVDIAFITVNYNTLEYIRQLAAFFRTLDAPFTFSFTVVDNCSHDGSREFLQAQTGMQYVQAGENLGYGRAINRGLAARESKYVCVLNTDVILNREALIALWTFLGERGDAGVCAPRILYQDGRDQGMTFQFSLPSYYVPWLGKFQAYSSKRGIAKAAEPVRVDGVMGAFFMARRSAMPSPLFDEDFFFFFEDTALAHTLWNRGVACFVVPSGTIVHIGGQSRSESSVALFYAGKYLYIRKFYGAQHARAVELLDRARIFRKWLWYSLLSRVTGSPRILSKQRYYRLSRNGFRPRA